MFIPQVWDLPSAHPVNSKSPSPDLENLFCPPFLAPLPFPPSLLGSLSSPSPSAGFSFHPSGHWKANPRATHNGLVSSVLWFPKFPSHLFPTLAKDILVLQRLLQQNLSKVEFVSGKAHRRGLVSGRNYLFFVVVVLRQELANLI